LQKWERFPLRRVAIDLPYQKQMDLIKMTLVERSTIPSSSSYGSSGTTQAADVPKDDLAAQGAAKTNIESVISDVSEKGHEALNYAGQKGQEAMDSAQSWQHDRYRGREIGPGATLHNRPGAGFGRRVPSWCGLAPLRNVACLLNR
jgi:hypothetical protein